MNRSCTLCSAVSFEHTAHYDFAGSFSLATCFPIERSRLCSCACHAPPSSKKIRLCSAHQPHARVPIALKLRKVRLHPTMAIRKCQFRPLLTLFSSHCSPCLPYRPPCMAICNISPSPFSVMLRTTNVHFTWVWMRPYLRPVSRPPLPS